MKNTVFIVFGIMLLSSLAMADVSPYGIQQVTQVNINGLNHAVTVANTTALTYLQNNINMLNQRNRNLLNNLSNLKTISINQTANSIIVSGRQKEYLLGFIPLKRNVEYQVGTAGFFSRVPNFFDFMWRV